MRRSSAAILVLAGALALPAVALAGTGDAGLSPIDPSSKNADGISAIYWFALAWAGLIFLAVTVPLVIFVVRFRSRGRPRHEEGPQISGGTRLELAWTAAPVVILVIIGAFVFYKVGGIDNPAGAASPGAIRVEGRQFYWQFVYPNGAISINSVRIPVGRVTEFRVTAPDNDVIHSFWVPQLDGKRDAIPGKVNVLKILPTQEGSYPIRCAELCGLQHAKMNGTVEVVPAAQYTAWVAATARVQQTPVGALALGKQIFEGACATCHGVSGEGFIGPKLVGSSVAAQPSGVAALVEHGGVTMPAVGQGWSRRELKALTTYLARNIAKSGGSTVGSQG